MFDHQRDRIGQEVFALQHDLTFDLFIDGFQKFFSALEIITADHREIVDLVYYHEKSVEEVAELIGIPENTVKTRLFYARKKLAELLKAAGIERGWP